MKEICGAGGMLGDVGWMVTGAGATRPAEGPAALSASDGGSFQPEWDSLVSLAVFIVNVESF